MDSGAIHLAICVSYNSSHNSNVGVLEMEDAAEEKKTKGFAP